MRFRLLAFALLAAAAQPGAAAAQQLALSFQGGGLGASFRAPPSTMGFQGSGFGTAGFSIRPPQWTQSAPLVKMRRSRVGQPSRSYGAVVVDVRDSLDESLRQQTTQQAAAYSTAAVLERNRSRVERSLTRSQGPRLHGVGANSSGYRYPIQ